jgi:drug/metabolite transporter (DMT)-like permease
MNRGGTFWKGEGAILLCAFLWSTSGLFIKLLDWHPVVIAGMRSLIAALFIFAVRLVFPPRGAAKTPSLPFWAAAVCYALTVMTFVTANKLTTSANAIMLQYSAPVWAGLLGWILLRERPRWEHWGALVLVIGGMILLFRDGIAAAGRGGLSLAGDIVAVVSGVLFSAHTVFLRMMKDGNTSDSLLTAHVISAVLCVPFIFLYPPNL